MYAPAALHGASEFDGAEAAPMADRRPGRPGGDLHLTRPDCLPTISGPPGLRLGNGHWRVKAETYPCAGHGIPTKGRGGISRRGWIMTYWIIHGDYREGQYPTRDAAQAAAARAHPARAKEAGA